MTIILVEDDYLAADGLISDLQAAFPGLDVVHISTESEFREKLDTIMARQPRAVVLDIMIRWTNPREQMTPPPRDIEESGPWRAGLRCANLLLERNPRLPIILYSVLEFDDIKHEIPPSVVHLLKSPEASAIIHELQKLGMK